MLSRVASELCSASAVTGKLLQVSCKSQTKAGQQHTCVQHCSTDSGAPLTNSTEDAPCLHNTLIIFLCRENSSADICITRKRFEQACASSCLADLCPRPFTDSICQLIPRHQMDAREEAHRHGVILSDLAANACSPCADAALAFDIGCIQAAAQDSVIASQSQKSMQVSRKCCLKSLCSLM